MKDLRILCKEVEECAFGPGILLGYPFLDSEPEEIYKGKAIGRFIFRDNLDKLPKFAAGMELGVFLEARTISELKTLIDKYLANPPDDPITYGIELSRKNQIF